MTIRSFWSWSWWANCTSRTNYWKVRRLATFMTATGGCYYHGEQPWSVEATHLIWKLQHFASTWRLKPRKVDAAGATKVTILRKSTGNVAGTSMSSISHETTTIDRYRIHPRRKQAIARSRDTTAAEIWHTMAKMSWRRFVRWAAALK